MSSCHIDHVMPYCVQVVILADPDGYEICFVGDEAFRELSQTDPEVMTWQNSRPIVPVVAEKPILVAYVSLTLIVLTHCAYLWMKGPRLIAEAIQADGSDAYFEKKAKKAAERAAAAAAAAAETNKA